MTAQLKHIFTTNAEGNLVITDTTPEQRIILMTGIIDQFTRLGYSDSTIDWYSVNMLMALMGTEYGDKFVTNLQSFRKLFARVDMKGKDFKGLNELAKTLRRELVRSKTAHRQVVCA